MIFLNDKPGQLCNQLWYHAPLIARALKYEVSLISLYFEDNFHHFENLDHTPSIKFGITKIQILDIYLRKIILNVAKKLPQKLLKTMNLRVDKYRWRNEIWSDDQLQDKKLIFFTGNGTRRNDTELLTEYHSEIKNIFLPKIISRNKVENIMSKYKGNSTIVGVHIRRGDYAEFLNGVYYYDDSTYINYMRQIELNLSQNGQKVSFLICSNDLIKLSNFDHLNIFIIPDATAIEDIYALSLCNYIIGPPSTFSMWASYIGKTPLKFIQPKHDQISLNEFSVIIAQDIFANGKTLVHV